MYLVYLFSLFPFHLPFRPLTPPAPKTVHKVHKVPQSPAVTGLEVCTYEVHRRYTGYTAADRLDIHVTSTETSPKSHTRASRNHHPEKRHYPSRQA